MRLQKNRVHAIGFFIFMICVASGARAEITQFFKAHNPTANSVIDHGDWQDLLDQYVKMDPEGLNRFNYAGVGGDDKAKLDAYIAMLEQVKVSGLNRDEQRAFWFNAYNAITVQIILEEWPVSSIRSINRVFFLPISGPWKREVMTIEGQVLSLDAIEHEILRPIWQDPRTHYGVNCASIGCPNLQEDAFTSANLEMLLEKGATEYVNSPRAILNVEGDGVQVSSIYHWFEEDFGENDSEILAHIRSYADGETAKKLEAVTRISGHDYDWGINAFETP